MGLPRSAIDRHIDTKQPRNLRDCDFDEDTTEMPPSRPETEWTPILPLIARGRHHIRSRPDLRREHGYQPSLLRRRRQSRRLLEEVHNHAIRPFCAGRQTTSITDSPNLVVQRISVETTYHKSRILLYRRALLHYPSRQPQERDRDPCESV